MFISCSGLTNVTIPNSVTRIGGYAFSGCTSLAGITIPDSVSSIESNAFRNCNSLTSIMIPASISNIGNGAFSGCSNLNDIVIDPDNPYFSSAGIALLNKEHTVLISLLGDVEGIYTVPSGVTSIADYALSNRIELTSVILPDSVTSIGNYAFYNGVNLTSVTLPDNLISIGNGAFNGCSNLVDITIPDSVTSIGGIAFNQCRSLTNITIPDGVTNIGNATFSGCSSLTNIEIPSSVTSIGSDAFWCSGLTSITIPDSVTSIGVNAFSECNDLTEVTIGNGVNNIAGQLCSMCPKLTSISIPDTITSIGDYAFYECYELEDFTIPNGVTWIGESAFTSCIDLTDIVIPDSVTSIGYSAFSNCTNLESVTIPASVTNIEYAAFSGCPNLVLSLFQGSYAETYAMDYGLNYIIAGEIHVWGEPEWIWTKTEEGYTAKAKFTCENDETHVEMADAEVTAQIRSDEEDNYIVLTATAFHDGSSYTDEKRDEIVDILSQPENAFVNELGEKATISVEAAGTGLTYQWYYKNAGTSKFFASSNKTSTYSVTVTERVKNRLVYCLVTDVYGNQTTSDTAGIYISESLEILEQPQDVYVNAVGDKATVSVLAAGTGLTYQWYYKNKGNSKFFVSTNKTPTYSVTVNDRVKNRLVYCVITDAYGNSVTTDPAGIYVYATLEIVQQPQNVFVNELGEKATVSVVATGTRLTYQWYYKNKGVAKFFASTNKTPTYSVTVNDRVKDRQIYCEITDAFGETVTTETVGIYVNEPLEILTQPHDVSVSSLGEKATVSVDAKGTGLTYQWYYKNRGSSKFFASSNKTAVYSVTVNERVKDRRVYCEIRDAFGGTVITDTAMITVETE